MVTPVGAASGTASSASIGPTGGTLQSADGKLRIVVPPGALASATSVSIQPITNLAPGRAGALGYRLAPEGLVFAQPVQLSYNYQDADVVGSSADALGLAYQQAAGTWRMLSATVDKTARTVSVRTSHFSAWSLVKGFQLKPGRATLQPGTSQALTLSYCFVPLVGDNDPMPIGYDCDASDDELAPLVPVAQVSNWSVSGTPGGTAAVGRVVGSGRGATYTAPSSAPVNNPVAVSADVQGQGVTGKTTVVANITILDADYVGSVSFTQQDPAQRVTVRTDNLAYVIQRLPNGNPVVTPGGDMVYDVSGGVAEVTINKPNCTEVRVTMPLTIGVLQVHGENSEVGPSYQRKYYFWAMASTQASGQATCQAPGTSASTETLTADVFVGLDNNCAPDGPNPDAAPPWMPSWGSDRALLQGSSGWTCGDVRQDNQWQLRRR